MALSFDDEKPKPKPEKRMPQTIFLLPSLRAEIDRRRGKVTRSAWIEGAIRIRILTLKDFGSTP